MKKAKTKKQNKPVDDLKTKIFRDVERSLLPFEENWHCRPDSEREIKNNISIRDSIADEYPDVPLLFLDPVAYDKAILGVCEGFGADLKIAYDYDKIIEVNMSMDMTYEEAVEWFEYNQIGAFVGDNTPVYIRKPNSSY